MESSREASESALLAALTHLMARWSSTSVQESVAASAGVRIDSADIPALYMLGLEGPSRSSALAAALHLTRPTMSKQLARLERAGLIERRTDPSDGRASVIILSPAGGTAHRRLVAEGVAMLHSATAAWDDAETARFTDQLSRLVAELSGPTEPVGGEPASDSLRPNPRS
ncbi:MarR family winged helix-turn-helix transcriptional regulator [uncultured Microbacterium sp.]|uniref:MarR family winged helix-turn-helix transcriptional regulator n=1 Tax=uncultured Microbacterium sp. TaxID=191216 RepID=UPI00262FB91E|nr:MarR family winged helix-turn-helix transcriptional regulator [uncultured Microbacterium sp.]